VCVCVSKKIIYMCVCARARVYVSALCWSRRVCMCARCVGRHKGCVVYYTSVYRERGSVCVCGYIFICMHTALVDTNDA